MDLTVVTWTLPGWQPVAEHFGTRAHLLLVKAAVKLIDHHRHTIMSKIYGPGYHSCRISPPGY